MVVVAQPVVPPNRNRRRNRARSGQLVGAVPGPAITTKLQFATSDTRFHHIALEDLTSGAGGVRNKIDAAYGKDAVPVAVETRALCCGSCGDIELAIGNRLSAFPGDDILERAWLQACTRLKVPCNGPPMRIPWPADLRDKTFNNQKDLLYGLVVRACGCKDTTVTLYTRIWVKNAGGCTIFGGVPSVIPAGGGNGSSNTPLPTPKTRYPIVVNATRQANTWEEIYNCISDDFGLDSVPVPTNVSQYESGVRFILSHHKIVKSRVPQDEKGQKYVQDTELA